MAAARAERANWIYGRWDVRELPLDIEDWPQGLLVMMASDRGSEIECDRMLAEHDAARRAIFRVVK